MSFITVVLKIPVPLKLLMVEKVSNFSSEVRQSSDCILKGLEMTPTLTFGTVEGDGGVITDAASLSSMLSQSLSDAGVVVASFSTLRCGARFLQNNLKSRWRKVPSFFLSMKGNFNTLVYMCMYISLFLTTIILFGGKYLDIQANST